MFELLVPPEQAQLDRFRGGRKTYDVELRPRLMVEAIRELQDAGVDPDVWKVEGLDRREDCQSIVAAARDGGRDHVGCIVLGRGEDNRKVRHWLGTAAGVCRVSSVLRSVALISGIRWSPGGPGRRREGRLSPRSLAAIASSSISSRRQTYVGRAARLATGHGRESPVA